MVDWIRKSIAAWEIKYGQIQVGGEDYPVALKLFGDFVGRQFTLHTFRGDFPRKHLIHTVERKVFRFACKPFFGQLTEDTVVYLFPSDETTIAISDTEPEGSLDQGNVPNPENSGLAMEVPKPILDLIADNLRLRQVNQELLKYKDRLEKYQSLNYIFEDERFMEDWLERNIHRAIPHLEIMDRQPSVLWPQTFRRNRLDFLCKDRTTRQLVVVENKVRGRHRDVAGQYLAYKAWVMRNLQQINQQNAYSLNSEKVMVGVDRQAQRSLSNS